jgi:hypothetical protein
MGPAPRVEQSRAELGQLNDEFQGWLARRRGEDARKRYHSQLRCLEQVLLASLEVIGSGLDLPAPASAGETYERCRAADRQLVFARRLWDYYREKWDQRDDPELGAVLVAADEIAWSCYRPAFACAEEAIVAPPLPHIVSDFSAYAIATANVPPRLRPEDELLREIIDELPVPIVGLPRICVAQPWWLALLAHEVGHHVAYTVFGGEIPAKAADLLAGAVREAGSEPGDADRWRTWSHEVFADAYAVALVGAAHLWLLAELLQGSDEAMAREASRYPPPLIRFALARSVLEGLGVQSGSAIPRIDDLPDAGSLSIPEAERGRLEAELAAVPAAAAALVGNEWAAEVRLADLAGCDSGAFGGGGAVDWWRAQFAGGGSPGPEETLEAPRLACAGALAEWNEVVASEDTRDRGERRGRLRQRMLEVVPRCSLPGRRAPRTAAIDADVADLAARTARKVGAIAADDPSQPLY